MIGQQISHYRVVDELGRGGMGVVYDAESDEPVHELKVVENWFAERRRVAPPGD